MTIWYGSSLSNEYPPEGLARGEWAPVPGPDVDTRRWYLMSRRDTACPHPGGIVRSAAPYLVIVRVRDRAGRPPIRKCQMPHKRYKGQ